MAGADDRAPLRGAGPLSTSLTRRNLLALGLGAALGNPLTGCADAAATIPAAHPGPAAEVVRPRVGGTTGWGDLCGELGFTRILLWDSSFADSSVITSAALMANAERALFPWAIALGHANAPTVTRHLTEILDLIRARGLRPATLDQVFGTSRTTG